jgi:peptide/nickel transport system permease protein
MLRYSVLRVLQGLVVVFLVTTLVFLLLHLAPGDPVTLLVGEAQMTPEQMEQIRRFWGLDQPVHLQYLRWAGNMLRGDFGESIGFGGRPVDGLLRDAAPNTIQLNALALVASVALAIPAGIVAAARRYSLFDGGLMVVSTLGISLPNFWLGLMLIVLFSLTLRWLPPFGQTDWKSYLLPVVVLASEQMALLARMMRSMTLEVMGHEYVTTARAKGLAEPAVLLRHIVRNALLPIITIVGYRVGFLLSGTVVVETVFAWPGVGRLLFQSIGQRDYVVVQAIVTLGAVVVVGTYEYDVLGAVTVWPPITGEWKYSIGSFAVACDMNACQISAGSVPPVTPATPSTYESGISALG